ncbi:type II secretion system protein GspG [Patescibacteria group bacterium]|nr:type II secretion system protein GspG [Patescibacteria group bacterium]
MENDNIIKNRRKGPSKILILLIVLLPILSVYFFKNDIISILDSKRNISQQDISDIKAENNNQDVKKEHTEAADFILDKFGKANDQLRKANLRDIKFALQLYADVNNGNYPLSIEETKLSNQDSEISKNLVNFTGKDSLKDPKDPEYYYTYQSSDGKSFRLTARLENIKDSECKIIDAICIYKITN